MAETSQHNGREVTHRKIKLNHIPLAEASDDVFDVGAVARTAHEEKAS